MAISRPAHPASRYRPPLSSSSAACENRLLPDYGLANIGALAVEVFDPAAGEHQVGVGLKLAPDAAFALRPPYCS